MTFLAFSSIKPQAAQKSKFRESEEDHMKTQVIVAVAVCVLAVVMAPCSLAQLRIMDGIIVSDNNPNTPAANANAGTGDLCVANPCAQEFSVGSSGAYVDRIDLGIVLNGEYPPPGPLSCPFSITITDALLSTGLGNILLQRNESITVPEFALSLVPFSDSFPAVWLPPGTYYVVLNIPFVSCGGTVGGTDDEVEWDTNVLRGVPSQVGSVGPGFIYDGIGSWLTLASLSPTFPAHTFAFTLWGPLILPPIGGGKFQRSRLVVEGPVRPPAGGPVEAQLGFLDLVTGALLAPLTPVTINPGQLQSVDLDLTPFATRLGDRIEVQPVIVQTPGEANPGPQQISATVQTLDAITGFETVLAPVPQPGTSSPSLGPQILAGGQTMRVNIYAAGPDPCVAQVGFNDMNGDALIPTTSVNQAPGTGTSVDLNSDALQLKLGQRIEALPVITVTAPVGAVPLNSVCNISSEVYDHLTGRTMTHQGMLAGLPAVQSPAQTAN